MHLKPMISFFQLRPPPRPSITGHKTKKCWQCCQCSGVQEKFSHSVTQHQTRPPHHYPPGITNTSHNESEGVKEKVIPTPPQVPGSWFRNNRHTDYTGVCCALTACRLHHENVWQQSGLPALDHVPITMLLPNG